MSAWKKGPMPEGTWHWGGIVEEGSDPKSGFKIADFRGDHVTLPFEEHRRVEAFDIAYYNNSLTFPITVDEPDMDIQRTQILNPDGSMRSWSSDSYIPRKESDPQ